MFQKQSENIVNSLINKNIIEKDKEKLVVYGVSMMIELFVNIITTLALGLMFGLVFESIIFILSYSFIRMYTNGYHCKSAINCYLFSCGIIVIFLILMKFVLKENIQIVTLVSVFICLPILLKFAPLSTKKRILDIAERKYFRKIMLRNLTTEIVIILVLLLLNLQHYAVIISLSILTTTILLVVQKVINITKYKGGLVNG